MLLTPLALSVQNQPPQGDFSLIVEPQHDELTPAQNQALKAAGFSRGTNTNWTVAGGSQGDDTIYEIQVDSNDDVIICGRVENDTQLGTILISTEGNGDIIIAKITAGGTWAWATVVGAPEYVDACRGIDIGPDDEIYATGYMRDTMDFGSITVYPEPGWDGWIGRIDSNGTWAWADSFGGLDVDVGWDVAVDSKGNLAVTGYFQNISYFGVAGEIVAQQQRDVYRYFLAYYNTSAEDFDWVVSSRGLGYSTAFQLTIDKSDDSIYTAGYNNGNEDYGLNNSSYPAGTWAGVVVKYNTHGSLIWLKSVSSTSCTGFSNCGVYFNNIVLHPSGGVVVGGHYLDNYLKNGGTVKSARGGWDLLVMYIDTDGNEVWSQQGGSSADDSLQALSINPKGQVQVGGSHSRTMNLGYVQINSSAVYDQFFIAQISTSGTWQWGMSNGGGENDNVGALLALPDGSIIAAGDFSGTVNLDNSYLTAAAGRDMFVWHFYHDADDDGVPDYTDNCITDPNLNQSNYDGDSWGDECDTDDDNDGLHDVLDDCNKGYLDWNHSDTTLDLDQDGCNDDEEDMDDDSDGILDVDDNCPRGNHSWSSSNQTDLDGDGCQDVDEDVDDDEDTILDIDDNCHIVFNTDQANYDGDLLGDACDFDDDSDGVDDGTDKCSKGALNWLSNGITDADGDGCRDDDEDFDDDDDGISDTNESGECSPGDVDWVSNQTTDIDGDGCRDVGEDTDDDNDGMTDDKDSCPQGITNWIRDTNTDSDNDGCRDSDEDLNDDNDEFPDITDDCSKIAGSANQGGKRGCPDSDGDGWADTLEPILFVLDSTQWADGDGDGFGDNPDGNNGDDCPFIYGNSTVNILGCLDSDGDGWADKNDVWTVFDGADALPFEPTQVSDTDKDGFGDNLDGDNPDYCINSEGYSTIDRLGCKDSDGDGYSDSTSSWNIDRWDTFSLGPDMFENDATQWRDSDGDGLGDNWGDESLNQTRPSEWPGVWVANAKLVDNCPLEDTENIFNKDNPGCKAALQVSNDGNSDVNDDVSSGEGSAVSTTMIVGISGVLVVLVLVIIIIRILKSNDGGRKSGPKLRDLPPPPGMMESSVDLAESSMSESLHEDTEMVEIVNSEDKVEVSDGNSDDEPKTVSSWQELPNGNYLEPDANGTVWYRDVDGNSWHQNPDESWSMWQ